MASEGSAGVEAASGLLARLRGSELAESVLSRHDFHLDRDWCADEWGLALESGEPMTGLASTGGGEAFLLCGGDERRPVVFYDAASSVMVIGRDLAETVEWIIATPYPCEVIRWVGLRGVDAALARHDENLARDLSDHASYRHDYLLNRRETHQRLAVELGLRALPLPELVERLRDTAVELASQLTVVGTDPGPPVALEHSILRQR